jgi:hypothetical protein
VTPVGGPRTLLSTLPSLPRVGPDLELADGADEVTADDPFDFSAHRYTTADLEATDHDAELPRRDAVYLPVDGAHCGLGTGSCGPPTLERYRLPPGERRVLGPVHPVRRRRSVAALTGGRRIPPDFGQTVPDERSGQIGV